MYLRAPSADRREILHYGQKCVLFCNAIQVQKYGKSPSHPHTKIRGSKNAKFGAISDEFKLRRKKTLKIGQVLDLPQFLPRSPKKYSDFKKVG